MAIVDGFPEDERQRLSRPILPRPAFDTVDHGVRFGCSDRVRPIRFPDPAYCLIADHRKQREEVSAPEVNRGDRKDQFDSERGIVGHRREAVVRQRPPRVVVEPQAEHRQHFTVVIRQAECRIGIGRVGDRMLRQL